MKTLYKAPSHTFILAIALLTCGLLVVPHAVFAQQATVFPFLRGSISARAAGLGGATVAMPEDVSMVVMNPAVLTTVEGKSAAATFVKHVLDINSGFATFADSLGDAGMYGVTAYYTSYGAFERTNSAGENLGSFSANDVCLAGTFSKQIDTLISWGGTVKFLYGSLSDQSTIAVALDAGLLVQIPKSRTNIGLSILNAGVQVSTYDGTSDRLPLDVRAGVNHRLRGLPLLVNFSLTQLADEVPSFFDRFLNFSVGGELSIGKYVRARLGYDHTSRNLSGVNVSTQMAGVSGGVGVQLETMQFDYALSSIGSSALLHRLSVGLML